MKILMINKFLYDQDHLQCGGEEKASPCVGRFSAGCMSHQQCRVSRSDRELEVGKIHGILGVTGLSSRVLDDLSGKISATYQR